MLMSLEKLEGKIQQRHGICLKPNSSPHQPQVCSMRRAGKTMQQVRAQTSEFPTMKRLGLAV
jgi:hypothetical protein